MFKILKTGINIFIGFILLSIVAKYFPNFTTIIMFGGLAIGAYYIYSKFFSSGYEEIEISAKTDNENLGRLINHIDKKFGLKCQSITDNSLMFWGENFEDEDGEKGEFTKRVRDLFRFEETDLPNFLKEMSKKSDFKYKVDYIKEDYEVVEVSIIYENKEHKLANAPEKYQKLSEVLGIKSSDGDIAILTHFEENEEEDHLVMKFGYVDGIQNIKKWNSNIETMRDYLGFNFVIDDNKTERVIEIKKVARVKTAIEFFKDGYKWEDMLKKGEIFEGMTAKGTYYRSLNGLSHTGVAGQSGSGKSVQLHLFLKSVFYNMEHFDKIYLGDLKGGLELSFLGKLGSDKLDFFGEAHEVLPIILNCELEMDSRMAYMKANGIRNITDNIILFVVDEYKQLNDLAGGKSGVSREVGNLIVNKIDRISALGRAMNIKLFLQSQNFTVDSIESSTRNNIQSLILMKTKNPEIQNACIPYSLREEMPNPADFTVGEKIVLDNESGKTTLVQALFTEPNGDVNIDNSLQAYKMGQENQDKVENLEEKVLPFKIKKLEQHLKNADNLNEEVLEWYENEYERLTGKSASENEEEEIIEAEVKPKRTTKKSKILDLQKKADEVKKTDNDLMNDMNDLLLSIRKD